MYTVQCRVIVDNKCEFQHSSSRGDCNFDARLVSQTRKYQQTNMSEIRQADLRSPTWVPHNKRRHVHISQSVNRSTLVSSANRFLSNHSSASTQSDAFRSIHPERRSDQLLVNEHSQVLRYRTYLPSLHLRHRAVVGSSSNRQGAISQCPLGFSLHIVCFPSSLSLHGPVIERNAQLCHQANGFNQLFLHPSLDVHN